LRVIGSMSWLENLKVDDKVGVEVSHRGTRSPEYYIGVVLKVTKTKVEVSLLGNTSTFKLPDGKTKVGQWEIPDQLVELTPEVHELVAHRRLASTLEKRLSAIRVKEWPLEKMQRLSSFLDSLSSNKAPVEDNSD
jgi:hypothetical protein